MFQKKLRETLCQTLSYIVQQFNRKDFKDYKKISLISVPKKISKNQRLTKSIRLIRVPKKKPCKKQGLKYASLKIITVKNHFKSKVTELK